MATKHLSENKKIITLEFEEDCAKKKVLFKEILELYDHKMRASEPLGKQSFIVDRFSVIFAKMDKDEAFVRAYADNVLQQDVGDIYKSQIFLLFWTRSKYTR